MNRNAAARKIQKRFGVTRKPLVLPRNAVNAITFGALGKIVVQAWNHPGGEVYYLNPSPFKHFLNRNGVYTSPRTRARAHYRYRRAVFVGQTPKRNNKNVMNKARNISKTISNQKTGRNLIPNNVIGTTNWAALQWSPPRSSPNWNISPIRSSNSNNANRHNVALLARLRQAAATTSGTRRRLNF